MRSAATEETSLRKELGLRDLVLAQVLCVVGSAWVGVAAKLGRAHVVFWLVAMLLFYLPLAAVVIYLNRLMPLEGGLYQWAKEGFGEMAGFLIAWNLWVYAVVVVGAIIFVVPTDISYMFPGLAWLPSSKLATLALTGSVMAGVTWVAVRGLDIGKWLHNAGSVCPLSNSSPAAPGRPRIACRAGFSRSAPPGQELVDLHSRLADHVLQVPVQRLHHVRDRLPADRFLTFHQAIPNVVVGLAVHQFHLQRDPGLNGRAIHLAELVHLAEQEVVAGSQAARLLHAPVFARGPQRAHQRRANHRARPFRPAMVLIGARLVGPAPITDPAIL